MAELLEGEFRWYKFWRLQKEEISDITRRELNKTIKTIFNTYLKCYI